MIFSPIIFNILNPIQAGIILCILSATLSGVASTIGFEEYNNIKKELEQLPKINNELQLEYKNNANHKI